MTACVHLERASIASAIAMRRAIGILETHPPTIALADELAAAYVRLVSQLSALRGHDVDAEIRANLAAEPHTVAAIERAKESARRHLLQHGDSA